jgi:hypothetical protein
MSNKMNTWRIFIFPIMALSMCSAQSPSTSVESHNQFGSSSSNGQTQQTQADTFAAAFEIQVKANTKQVKNSCAVCHNLELMIDGKLYADGETATLRKGKSYSITVKDTPVTYRPNTTLPPEHDTQEYTIWPKAVDSQTVTVIPDTGGEAKGFVITKENILQYIIDNNQKLLVQNKAWPKEPANEPMKKTAKLATVEFITPAGDPVNSPVSEFSGGQNEADGVNEFTYSTAEVGVLTIKLKAKVAGISNFDTTFQNRFKFEVDAIGNSTMAWNTANPGGQVTVEGDFIKATVTFTGLPQNNSDFGKKKARVMFDNQKAAEQRFEVFFSKNSKNHPNGGFNTPQNWFYYWKQGDVCGIPQNCIYYDSDQYFGSANLNTKVITLYRPASGTNNGPEEWTHKLSGLKLTTTAEGSGIQCVAETIRHELHHIEIYDHFGYDFPLGGDGDGIDNDEESTYDGISTSPSDPDTYGIHTIYSDYTSTGDQEVRCRLVERRPPPVKIHPSKDWANPGCQSFIKNGPSP